MQIEQGRVQATITPCRGGLLVVVERTPHPGSSDFVRQHARRPWLTGPQPEEVLRRVVPAEEAIRLLFREGLYLSLSEQDALTRLER